MGVRVELRFANTLHKYFYAYYTTYVYPRMSRFCKWRNQIQTGDCLINSLFYQAGISFSATCKMSPLSILSEFFFPLASVIIAITSSLTRIN